MNDVIREWVEKTMLYQGQERERQIRLALQPKPHWLPTWIWHRIIARLLVLQEPVSERRGGPTMMHWDRDAAEEREEQDQGHDWQVLSVWEAKRQQPSGTLSALIGCGGCGQAFVSAMMEPCPWPVDDREDRP